MNRESPPLWSSLPKWGVCFPVALAAAYFGSYWCLRHTEFGAPMHSWLATGGNNSAPLLQKGYEKFFTPAVRAERAWRIAMFGRELHGTWATEDGSVVLRFEGPHIVETSGLAACGISDGDSLVANGTCGAGLYLKHTQSARYMTVAPESIGRDTCVVRVAARRPDPLLRLHRVPDPSARP